MGQAIFCVWLCEKLVLSKVRFVAIQRYRFQSHGEQQESSRSLTASAPEEEEGRDQGAVHDGRDRGAYDQEEAAAAAHGGDGQ